MTRINAAIVGAKYHTGALDTLAAMPDGAMITLLREPTNEHDRNAIGVFYQNQRLGFIAAETAREIASIMDARGLARVFARFDKLDGQQCYAAVTFR